MTAGCVTGPRYQYQAQSNSAQIEGPVNTFQDLSKYGTCGVNISKIDGLVAGFEASAPGFHLFGNGKLLYLAPGKHDLLLAVYQMDTEYGDVGRGGSTVPVGDFTYGNHPLVTGQFVANHIYRFTANLSSSHNVIDLTLWDETSGVGGRSLVNKWTIDSNAGYSESAAPIHKR
jgi:hypothetical protein